MTSAEEALERFLASTAAVLALLDETLGDERWRLRPEGEPWSLAETVEHVWLTDQSTLARLRDRLPASPIPPMEPRLPDARITAALFEGVPAPPGLAEPSGRFVAREEGVAALAKVRDGVVDAVRAHAPRLREHGLPHPVFGTLDGVQWILFLGAHTDNHLPQVRRLRDAIRPRSA